VHALREIQSSDAQWIFDACQDSEIQYWTTVPRPYLIEHAQSFANGEFPEYKIWVIENIENGIGAPVGVISIHTVDDDGVAEIGYWIAPWGRGHGASADAIELVAQYAQDDSKILSLQACISDLNSASQKAARAAGLLPAGCASKNCPAGEAQTSATNYRRELSVSGGHLRGL